MLEDQMRAASPAYAALTQARVINAPELKAKLDEDTVLLEFALGRERSYGWAISRDRITAFRLPARDEIKRAAERLYQLVTAPRRGPARESPAAVRARLKREQAHFVAAASHFSNLMLGPVANELKGKRLVIVPGGELQHLPFTALPVPFCKDLPRCSEQSAGKAPAAAYIPLIAEHEVVILHSASVLASLRLDTRRQRPSKGIAVFADPVFSSDDERFGSRATRSASIEKPGTGVQTRIPRLFSTRAESDVILRNARAGQSLRVLDFEATRALATSGALADYLVIHFATHAFINNDHPELSAIALTALDKQRRPLEGFLRAHEIFNLKLNADLVVLSACKSGLGKEVRGEGLVGLTRAFMYAGAPRVIVSLWSLDDRATAELMARFYKHLLGPDKLTPSAALRAAQVEMWKDSRWSSPYYWAGFIQQGEWR
jgi:CHAT domain-containing protein